MMNKLIVLTAITVTVHGEHCASILNLNDDDSQYDKLKCTVCTSLGRFTSMSAKLTNLTNELVTIADDQKFMLSSNDLSQYRTNKRINAAKMIMRKFTPICQRYTDVMAHKYFLQHLLFQEMKESRAITQLVLVITKLQVLANDLLNAQVEEDNKSTCIKFTPPQYKTIYYSRLPVNKSADELNAICLLRMRSLNWQNKTDVIQLNI